MWALPLSHIPIDIDLALVNGSRFWKIWAFNLVPESVKSRILHKLFNGSGHRKEKTKKLNLSDCQRWRWWWPWLTMMVIIRMTCMVTEEESGDWHLRCQLKSVASQLFCQQAILHHNTIITDVRQVNWWFLLWNSTVKHDHQSYFMTSWMFLIQDGDTILYHCHCNRETFFFNLNFDSS